MESHPGWKGLRRHSTATSFRIRKRECEACPCARKQKGRLTGIAVDKLVTTRWIREEVRMNGWLPVRCIRMAAQPHMVLLEASDGKILGSPQNNVKVNLARGSAPELSTSMTLKGNCCCVSAFEAPSIFELANLDLEAEARDSVGLSLLHLAPNLPFRFNLIQIAKRPKSPALVVVGLVFGKQF